VRPHPPSRRDARSRVHHVTQRRIANLGAEVNSLGLVYVPKEKRDLFEARVRHRAKYNTTEVDDIYVGLSKFAEVVPSGHHRGRYRFDDEDIHRTIVQYKRYWLHDLRAVNADESIDTFLMNLGLRGAGRPAPHPWVAYLGVPVDPEGARSGGPPGGVVTTGTGRAGSLSLTVIRSAWEADPIEDPIHDDETPDAASHGPSGRRSASSVLGSGDGGGRNNPARGEGSSGCRGDRGHDDPEEDDLDFEGLFDGGGHVDADVAGDLPDLHLSLDRRGPGGGRDGQGPVTFGLEEKEEPTSSSSSSTSAFRFVPSPPRSTWFGEDSAVWPDAQTGGLQKRDVYLYWRFDPRGGLVTLGVQHHDGLTWGPVRVVQEWRRRPESFVVEAVSKEVGLAAADGVDVLVIRMEDNELPKTLMQMSRRVRTPTYFRAIRDLHRVAAQSKVHVIVGGPSQLPSALFGAVRQGEV